MVAQSLLQKKVDDLTKQLEKYKAHARSSTELDSIKKRYEEKDKFEKEILNNHQINLHEVTNLKYEIKNLNERIADFQNEKYV